MPVVIKKKKPVVRPVRKEKRGGKPKGVSQKYFKKKRVIRNLKKKPAKKVAKTKELKANKDILLHLDRNGIKFDVVEHRKVFTAYDLAQTLGEKLDGIAKTMLVEVELPELGKVKKGHYIVVLPASYRLNLAKLKTALKASRVGIAAENAMLKLGMSPGAMAPFGSLRKLGVAIDTNLLNAEHVLVGAESLVESLRMRAKDLAKLENAIVGQIGDRSEVKLQKKSKKKKRPLNLPVEFRKSGGKPPKKPTDQKPTGKTAKRPAKRPIGRK